MNPKKAGGQTRQLGAGGPTRQVGWVRERLQKGKAPCINLFTAAAFDIANIIYFFTKQTTFMRRSTVPSLPFQLVFLGRAKRCTCFNCQYFFYPYFDN
jgi:hypothetical protein